MFTRVPACIVNSRCVSTCMSGSWCSNLSSLVITYGHKAIGHAPPMPSLLGRLENCNSNRHLNYQEKILKSIFVTDTRDLVSVDMQLDMTAILHSSAICPGINWNSEGVRKHLCIIYE